MDHVAGGDCPGDAELVGEGFDDAQIRLVRNERGEILRADSRQFAGPACQLRCLCDGPAVDGEALLLQVQGRLFYSDCLCEGRY